MNNLSIILFLLVFVCACKKHEQEVQIVTKNDDYTGLKIGNTSFYDVRLILHDAQVDLHDTIDFKMKSIIEDTFRDNSFNLRYKIHQYRWNDTIASWGSYKIFSAFVKDGYYIDSEDNLLKKKLHIPYIYNFTWNSDSFNTNDTLHYRFIGFSPSVVINQYKIDSVIYVKQQFYQTYVDIKRKHEFFGKNKGLVYRYYKDLKIKKGDTTNIDKGEEKYFYLYQFQKGK